MISCCVLLIFVDGNGSPHEVTPYDYDGDMSDSVNSTGKDGYEKDKIITSALIISLF